MGGRLVRRRGTAATGASPQHRRRAEAITAAGDVLYVAVAERGVLASRDGGVTWTVRYSETGT